MNNLLCIMILTILLISGCGTGYIGPCEQYKEVGTYSGDPTNHELIRLAYDYYKSIGFSISKEDLRVQMYEGTNRIERSVRLNNYNLSKKLAMENLLCDARYYKEETKVCFGSLKFKDGKILKRFVIPC